MFAVYIQLISDVTQLLALASMALAHCAARDVRPTPEANSRRAVHFDGVEFQRILFSQRYATAKFASP